MKMLWFFIVFGLVVAATHVLAGTVEGNVDLQFDEAYRLIQEALKTHYGDSVFTPYRGEGKSINLKRDDYDYWDYENYKKYVLPAYIYSTEAQARTFYIINIRETETATVVTVNGFWEIETKGGWIKVESNNENETRFVNYLVAYCKDSSKYK